MKRILLFVAGMLISARVLLAQDFAIKNNVFYDVSLTPNLGVEIGLSSKSTFNIIAGYNPFEFGENKKFKHWLVQPEYRYWFCEKFNGTFIGIHLHGGEFSIAKLKLPFGFMSQLENHMYEGYFYGGGVDIGHQWILSRHWSFEAAIGVGYARVEADKYPCADCGKKLKSDSYNYFGPTKLALSFIYFLR